MNLSGLDRGLLSSYAGLLTLAAASVYIGAFGSLPVIVRTGEPYQGDPDGADEGDGEEVVIEHLSAEDAWLFPILGSVALFGLYTIVQYYGQEWINWFLGWYFAVAGIASVWKSLIAFTQFIVGRKNWRTFDKTSVSIKKGSKSLLHFSWRTPSVLLFPLAVIPSAIYSLSAAKHKPVLITNILSLSFGYNALSMLKLDSFPTGSILLSGLFLYDIWWVFGTEVMVKVATTLDVPIKLLWPRSLVLSDARGYTILGLGDVVVPGTFIALALRYDYYRSMQAKSVFRKPYFHAALIAYILGLGLSFFVLNFFGSAQPALLYLNPACILSFVITASLKGELYEAWNWCDGLEDEGTVKAKKSD